MSNLPGRAPAQPTTRQSVAKVVADAIANAPKPITASGPVAVTADELRNKIVELYRANQQIIGAFMQYTQVVAAVSEEFHARRLQEAYPQLVHEELTLACKLDARETPKSLDAALAALGEVKIRRVIFDRANCTYYLFV